MFKFVKYYYEKKHQKVMEGNESVLKLLTEKDKYKNLCEEYKETCDDILCLIYNMGGPLNDNKYQYNNEQLEIFRKIAGLVGYGVDEDE